MVVRKALLAVAIMALTTGAFSAGRTEASSAGPLATMQTLGDQLLTILRNPDCKADAPSCREKLRQLVEVRWDTVEMSRSALGVHWKELNDQDRQQFTKLFATLLEGIYLNRSNFSKAQQQSDGLSIEYLKEVSEGDGYSQVNTLVSVPSRAKPVNINYRLRQVDGEWKVYDVLVADISIVGNYRNQFNRVINNQGFPELVKQLQQKVRQVDTEQGA
jgi:phospholipid transport system substrate-binding protein